MPTGFLSHLMTALLAMHTVLGCCWHHAHACGQDCRPATSLESPDAHAGHGGDCCITSDSAACQNHGPHTCQEGPCVYLKTTVSNADIVIRFDLPPCVCVESSDVPSRAAASHPLLAAALLAPLPLYLAHQVLLL